MNPSSHHGKWNLFLFRLIDVKQYAVLRICLGSIIAVYLIQLYPLADLHLSPDGWLGGTKDLHLHNSGSWSVIFWLRNSTQSHLFLIAAIVCSTCFTLGLFSRASGLLTLIALISIWNRNPLILDGDDAILRVTLFYLLLAPCGNAYSIDSLIFKTINKAEIWPLRLIQFQLAFIYFVSGWVKFHSPEWQNVTILHYVLTHPEYSRWDFTALINRSFVPTFLGLITFAIKWWELLFPLLIFWKKTRPICLFIGVLFHLNLLVLMNLRLFSIVMLTLYIAFIPSHYFEKIRGRPLKSEPVTQ